MTTKRLPLGTMVANMEVIGIFLVVASNGIDYLRSLELRSPMDISLADQALLNEIRTQLLVGEFDNGLLLLGGFLQRGRVSNCGNLQAQYYVHAIQIKRGLPGLAFDQGHTHLFDTCDFESMFDIQLPPIPHWRPANSLPGLGSILKRLQMLWSLFLIVWPSGDF